jgi:protein-tyrosine phosphatase
VGGGMAAFLPPEAYKEAGLEYHMIDETLDEASYPMLEKHWEEAKSFLDAADCCVVHCLGGENRSVLIATAYYMIHTNTPLLKTIDYCCKKVGGERFLTNPGFQQQLVAFARYERLLE